MYMEGFSAEEVEGGEFRGQDDVCSMLNDSNEKV